MTERSRKNDPAAMRARILDAAAELFQNKGYSQTSTQDITKAAGVTSGALHHHYSTKKALGLAVIRERVARAVEGSWIDPMRDAPSAAEGVRTAFLTITSGLEKQSEVRGCPLNNLAIELAFADPEFRSALEPIFDEWRAAIADRIRQEEQGPKAGGSSPEQLATLVVAAYSGAMTMAKAAQSPDALLEVLGILDKQLRPSFAK